MLSALDAILDESSSNLTDEELLGLMLELYPMLKECTVVSQQIPADGTYRYATVRGMSFIDVDLEANREILKSLLPKPEEPQT